MKLNPSPRFRKGDRCFTDFHQEGDRRVYTVLGFKRVGKDYSSSGYLISLSEKVCCSCKNVVPATGWIDASWARTYGKTVGR